MGTGKQLKSYAKRQHIPADLLDRVKETTSWSGYTIRKLVALWNDGVRIKDIAQALGKTPKLVRSRILIVRLQTGLHKRTRRRRERYNTSSNKTHFPQMDCMHGGMRTCNCCGEKFHSPNVRNIHTCNTCKANPNRSLSEDYTLSIPHFT